jgi:lipase maturation factor 1
MEARPGPTALGRWLRGGAEGPPSYRRMRSILLRGLGLVYLAAFGSMGVQVDGLLGRRGILPAADFLAGAKQALGTRGYWQFPTLLWLNASDAALHGLCWGGVAVSVLLIVGLLPAACLALLWAAYLSLVVVGQDFLGFQWDSLLLEAGLLGVLFAPWGVWLGRARREPSVVVLWLFRWLVFRLMFLSGVVKLTSGDPTWRAWEAMKYHYETQPLPAWTSWYMHQLPPWFHALSVGFMFWAELIAPFLVFAPRRPRMVGFWSLVLLQALIAATGNYGFFNLLSLVLCLSLVEDWDWGRRDVVRGEPAPRRPWRQVPIGAAGAVIVLMTAMEGIDRSGWTVLFPEPLEAVRRWLGPFRSLNAYGLFAVMTTERPEILVEGSDDGETWIPYRFRWKPGEPGRRPRFTTPHMPRLDWQMWFAALARDCLSQTWFLRFEQRLLEGSPEVLRLLRDDPFRGRPPRYIRARLDLYHFTHFGAKDWWTRQEVGTYCPPLGLRRTPDPPAP